MMTGIHLEAGRPRVRMEGTGTGPGTGILDWDTGQIISQLSLDLNFHVFGFPVFSLTLRSFWINEWLQFPFVKRFLPMLRFWVWDPQSVLPRILLATEVPWKAGAQYPAHPQQMCVEWMSKCSKLWWIRQQLLWPSAVIIPHVPHMQTPDLWWNEA